MRMQRRAEINNVSPISSFSSVQFSLVTQSHPNLCDPMNHSTPGLPVLHQLPEFTQTHVHRVSDAIYPSHPLSSPSPPAPNPVRDKRKYVKARVNKDDHNSDFLPETSGESAFSSSTSLCAFPTKASYQPDIC